MKRTLGRTERERGGESNITKDYITDIWSTMWIYMSIGKTGRDYSRLRVRTAVQNVDVAKSVHEHEGLNGMYHASVILIS